MKRIFYLLLPA